MPAVLAILLLALGQLPAEAADQVPAFAYDATPLGYDAQDRPPVATDLWKSRHWTTTSDADLTTPGHLRVAAGRTSYSYDPGSAPLGTLSWRRSWGKGKYDGKPELLAYARARWYDAETAHFLSPDPMGAFDSPNQYAFVAWSPHMYTDPTGAVRYTANGGANYFGDFLNEVELSSDSFFAKSWGAIALDTAGNSISTLLALDLIADSSFVAGDYTNSGRVRAVAAAKGTAVAALDVAGGAILKGVGGLALRIPGVRSLGARIATASGTQALAGFLGRDVAALATVDSLVAGVRSSAVGRFLRRDVGTFLPGRSPSAVLEGLAQRAQQLHSVHQHPRAVFGTTSGVMSTREGRDVLASGVRNLSKKQKNLFMLEGDLAASLTNRRIQILKSANPNLGIPNMAHAEVTAYYRGIMEAGLSPTGIVAYPQRICATQCTGFLRSVGAELIDPWSAWWFSPVNLSNRVPLGGVLDY